MFAYGGSTSDLAEEINEYGFIFSGLAPLGLYLAKKVPFRRRSVHEAEIRGKAAELFGRNRVLTFVMIHNAQRVVLTLLAAVFTAVILIMGDAEPAAYLFVPVLAFLVFYWADRRLDKKIEKRKRDILTDLPVFINTLALLVNAGLTYGGAVQKTVRGGKSDRPLYKEFNTLLAEISTGKPAKQAYEELAMRCRVPEITRFVSTVLQNINRGSADLVHALHGLACEAWEKRKEIAKKQGEEAAAKLVFPMVMVFLAVAIIVIAPAVMTMTR